MICLGIDPDNAWGLVDGKRRLASGHTRKGLDDEALLFYWDKVFRNLPVAPDVIFVEGQFLKMWGDETAGARIGMQKATIKLSRRAGLIAGLAFALLRQVPRLVQSKDWRKTAGLRERTGRAALKQAARDQCLLRFRVKVTDDEADALLIALHGANVVR